MFLSHCNNFDTSSPFVTNIWMCISKCIVFDHKESFISCVHLFLTLPGYLQCNMFMNHVSSSFLFHVIHSLSGNKSSAEGMYAVFVALQMNPSLQKLEWVETCLSFLLVKILVCCYALAWLIVWIPDSGSVQIRWLCAFLTDYHGSNKSFHLGPTIECAYQNIMWWPQGIVACMI